MTDDNTGYSELGALTPGSRVLVRAPHADWAESDSDADGFIENRPDLSVFLTEHQDISGKADRSTTYTKTEVDAIVAAVKTGSRQVVASLASVTDPQPLVIYMVAKSTAQTNNTYDEYIYITVDNVGKWEKIGDTEIDLSGYARTASLAAVATSGSYNDLTNKPTIPAAVAVDSALSDSSENPVQNKVVTAALNGKATAAQGAKADAALSRAEAKAGYTRWTVSRAPSETSTDFADVTAEITQPTFANGGWFVASSCVEGDTAAPATIDDPVDSVVIRWFADYDDGTGLKAASYVATRTRLPTMADIPTDNAQLTNGAGYATTAAMNAALAGKENTSNKVVSISAQSTDAQYPSAKCVYDELAGKADASALPYALVNVTLQDGDPYVPAEMFPIVATHDGATTTYTDATGMSFNSELDPGNLVLIANSVAIAVFDATTGGFVAAGYGDMTLTFGDPAHSPTSADAIAFTPTAPLTDRAINAVSLTESATLAFPAQKAGKARDFVVRLTLTETNDVVPSVTFPADVAYETEGGEWPDLTEAGTYIVRLTEVPTASVSEMARFFLQCSSAVADATPLSAGGGV